MNVTEPLIDQRTQSELARQIRLLLLNLDPKIWDTIHQIESDPWTDSLVQIYARFMEVIINHINRVPDKSFLSFLDTLGIGPLPPKPAKTPLTFTLAKGAPAFVKVRSGTQVAAKESPDGKPVIFETTDDIDVIQPKPVKVVSMLPNEDKWHDHSTVLLNDENDEIEQLLSSTELIKHQIFFGHIEQFTFEENKLITLKVEVEEEELSEAAQKAFALWQELSESDNGNSDESSLNTESEIIKKLRKIRWYTYSQESEEPVELLLSKSTNPLAADLLQSGDIHFLNVPAILEKELKGYKNQNGVQFSATNRWIIAELTEPVTEQNVPGLLSVNCLVEDMEAGKKYYPDLAFANKMALDVTKDFYPFGERPKFNDTFYLTSNQVLSKQGASISIEITFSQVGVPSNLAELTLSWEYWNGAEWLDIPDLIDNTTHFTAGTVQTVAFTCPKIKEKEIYAEVGTWIRVRLTGGDFGQDAQYEQKPIQFGWEPKEDPDDPDVPIILTVWSLLKEESFEPPIIQKITLSYTPDIQGKAIEEIVTLNNFFYKKQSFNPNSILPFESYQENFNPAFYLGFDQSISELPINLFFPLVTEVYAAPASDGDIIPPRLKWEYWNGNTWYTLGVEDETKELTRRGIISSLIPENCNKCVCFEHELHWIRARLVNGVYPDEPQLKGIYNNAVWSQNKVTVIEELLGSGNGTPGQKLQFTSYPILPGQQLYVRESEITAEEKQAIMNEEGADSFIAVEQASGISETWVRWHEVNHFWFSGPHSRHYQLDRQTGTITFGDGVHGMIPQAGRNNIKAFPYMHGGGARGNVQKGQLTKMRKAIAYVDKSDNPVDAEGGTDVENLQGIRLRGPRSLRHRNKAVTLTDYEWIVLEASAKIARAKGLPVTNPQKQFKPGWVTIMIVPHSNDVKPLPSAELISEVTDYLSLKAPSCLTDQVPLQQINLIPPNYLRVDVTAKVVVKSIKDAKEAENLVYRKLMTFLHPLKGGEKGKGWEFGRDVYKSEIYEILEDIELVDYVDEVALNTAEQIYELQVAQSLQTTMTFPERSSVQFEGNKISMVLAEALEKGSNQDTFRVLGFMEGDRIELKYEIKDEDGNIESTNTAKLYVLDCQDVVREGDQGAYCLLKCSSVEAEAHFPAGDTKVETYLKPGNLKVKSYLMSEIEKGKEIEEIKIAVPVKGDRCQIIHRDWHSNTVSEVVTKVSNTIETVYLEKDYLVYSGNHSVGANIEQNDLNGEPKQNEQLNTEVQTAKEAQETDYQYLLNTNSGEIHDLSNIKQSCSLHKMKYDHMNYLFDLDGVQEQLGNGTYDYCAWCFGKDLSKR